MYFEEPEFDDSVSIDHIQGLLYAYQAIKNLNETGQGINHVFEFNEISLTNINEFGSHILLSKLAYHIELDNKLNSFMNRICQFETIDKISMHNTAKEWLPKIPLKTNDDNLVNNLITLIYFLGPFNNIYKLSISSENRNNKLYPWAMNLYWGMNFDIIVLSGADKTYMLRLGAEIC